MHLFWLWYSVGNGVVGARGRLSQLHVSTDAPTIADPPNSILLCSVRTVRVTTIFHIVWPFTLRLSGLFGPSINPKHNCRFLFIMHSSRNEFNFLSITHFLINIDRHPEPSLYISYFLLCK